VLIVVLSETTAREAGERAALTGLVRMRAFVELVERGLSAVVMLGEWVDRSLASLLPPKSAEEQDDASVERFRRVVSSEADVGPRGNALLTGVFALGDRTVADVMTPRTDVVGIEHDAPWAAVVARIRSSEHARLVVYGDSLDHIVGFLYAKDMLPFIASGSAPAAGWGSLIRPPSFIPASKRVDAQLRDFRAHRRHIAIVADEFGGTAGLVTIEDLLELIVGEIRDEYDVEEPEIQEQDGARFWVAGRLTLDQLSDYLGDDLRRDGVNTVGGLAYELFGRIPKPGEAVDFRSWHLVVERVRGRRVDRVFLERHDVAVGAEDGA
jgi:CBS domain containing-hemolysin-like protein